MKAESPLPTGQAGEAETLRGNKLINKMIHPYHPFDKPALVEILKHNVPKYFDPQEVAEFEEYLKEYANTYRTVEHENKIVGGMGYLLTDNNTIFFSAESPASGPLAKTVK
jgi:hypothetical protein